MMVGGCKRLVFPTFEVMMLTFGLDKLPGHFTVWLASEEAAFLRNKYVWVNWDVEELIAKAKHIQESKDLEVYLGGVPM